MTSVAPRLTVGDQAPDITLLDIHCQPLQLSTYWPGGPTLVNFLRHFGCLHCRKRLTELERYHDQIKAAGLQSLTIALGQPKHAERYCGRLAPSEICFAAITNDPYYAWGLRQGTMGEFFTNALNVMKASTQAMAKGNLQGLPTGDQQMLPGTFIVDQQGIVRYAYYSQYAGDDPAIPDVLAFAGALETGARGYAATGD